MTKNAQHDQLDSLVRRSFDEPIPADTREALQQELKAVREAWRAKADRSCPVLAVRGIRPRMTWLAAGACVLVVIFGATRLALNRLAARKTTSTRSYACATAHYPVSSARCTAVFYSKDDPTDWVERRMIVLDPQGNVTKVIVYNRKRS
jgi:hypothetical protein